MKGITRQLQSLIISLAGGVIFSFLAAWRYPETQTAWMTGFGLGFSIASQIQNIILNIAITKKHNNIKLQYSVEWARKKYTQLSTELMQYDHLTHRRFMNAVITDLEDHLLEIRNIVGKGVWRTYQDRKGALGDIKPILTQEIWDEEAGPRAIGSLRTLIRDLPDELNDLQQMNSE